MKTANKIFIISLIFFLILYTVCRFKLGIELATGVLYGYILAVLNFYALARKVTGMLEGGSFGFAVLNSQIRLLITGAILWAAIEFYGANVVGLLVGLSIIPISIPAVVLYKSFREND
ncbi:ATP synthase subunit I [Limisalsivibrio acetivorans]|uniref:ATP synthase subunit I n=1 Tax=Limisalsivibrio acetivorans TaxID=1304888 RepID=UPI0003B662A0|nr:ATP synthase subunit I [Limisalsivibrio acetivorans]